MRILIINDLLGDAGGAETFVYSLKRNLEKRGHIVELLGSKEGEDFNSYFSRWNSRKWYRITRDKIRAFKPQIVHVNNCSRVLSPSVIKASLDNNVPVVFTLHDYHLFCPRLWGIKDGKPCTKGFGVRCIFSNCESFRKGWKYFPLHLMKIIRVGLHRRYVNDKRIRFVSPSAALGRSIKKSLGVDVIVINNGVDLPERQTNYKKSILFVGRISREKGLQTIIDKLNNVKDYNLFVLGKGFLKDELESRAKNVKFLGFKKPEDFYVNSSIALVPSIWLENFSYSVIEAMSYGLCVIASNRGGIPEQIKHKKTGLIFEAGDGDDFEEKLNYLLENPSEIKRIGKNARKFVKDNFSWEKVVKDYEKLYLRILKS
jgi:glycosyltransferase involved in cell wall biosynthesis